MFDLYSVIAGIALGLSLGIPPGPVNAAIAAESAKKSYVGGIMIGLGAMTSDFIYLVLTVIGVAVLLTGSLARNVISLAGGLILIYFAVSTLKAIRKPREEAGLKSGNLYLTGLAMGMTNPLGILWWVTAGAAFVALFNILGVAGFMLGLFTWVSGFSLFIHYAGKRIDLVYPAVIIASGLMMLFFGLLLWYGVVKAALGV